MLSKPAVSVTALAEPAQPSGLSRNHHGAPSRTRRVDAGERRELPAETSRLALRKASVIFDAARDFAKIRAQVLYVLSRTDKLFPPSLAPSVMAELARAGVQATYFEIDTELGHVASGPEWAKWAPTLRAFLDGLERA